MPPFDPKAAARQIGGILGLTEGPDVSSKLNIRPGAWGRLDRAIKLCNAQSEVLLDRSQALIRALYLPGILALVCDHTVIELDRADPGMAPVCAHTLRTMAYSSDVSRFVREYPTRIAAYGPKLLLKIVTTADLFENGIYQVICMLTNLIAIYNALWIQDRMSQDKTNTVDLFQVPPSLRLQLKTRYARMKSYGSAHETEPEKVAYDQALSDLGLALFPEMYVVRRGTDYIDGEIASEGYLPWWACEARHPHTGVSGPGRACDAGARDQLRVCDRCLSVRYCSERHQSANWKKHQPDCVAPTW